MDKTEQFPSPSLSAWMATAKQDEYCWLDGKDVDYKGVSMVFWEDRKRERGDVQFRITRNEAGDVIKLERVES